MPGQNKFEDVFCVKNRKERKCSLCGSEIKKGELKYFVVENVGKKKKEFHCHRSCFNDVCRICEECKNNCTKSCAECFREKARVVTKEEVMAFLRPIFEWIPQIKYAATKKGVVYFYSYSDAIIGVIKLKTIFGENASFPEEDNKYRDWYEEK